MPTFAPKGELTSTSMPKNASDTPTDPRPIGVFDSGVGGLTVVRALRQALPQESIVYLGDTARVPYGIRSGHVVRRYANSCAQFLLQRDAKMVIVACNTASAFALADLQTQLSVPTLGVIEAGARAAAAQVSSSETIAVIGTEGTIASQAYQKALARLAPAAQVVAQPCPLLVALCEEGLVDHEATRLILADYLLTVRAAEPAVLLLGCTHYPLLRPAIADFMGPGVTIIDSASAVAQDAAAGLRSARLTAPDNAHGTLTIFATDTTSRMERVASRFLGETVRNVELVDI